MSIGPLFLIATAGILSSALAARSAPRVWLASTMVGLVAALAAAISVLAGRAEWTWQSPWAIGGEPLRLHFDALSALFLALLCVVGGAGSVYSREYWADSTHPRSARSGRMWWSVLLLSLGMVLLTSNGLHFLIAWEVFTVSAYFLVTLDRQNSDVRKAGWLYLAASHVGMVFLFAYFGALAARTGGWELGPMRDAAGQSAGLAPLFWLALLGFGIKCGAFPLHIWLPSAHACAPSHVSAILSGVTIKMGVYGLVRFSGWMPVPPGAGWAVAGLGVVSAVLGVAFAIGQHDLKRLLAYHSVENIGIILIGLGFALIAAEGGLVAAGWGGLALAGALLHVWNHGLFKALLFLGAGSVLHATGTREMSRLGGLWRAMPWTAGLFALGAMAICGLPPLNGFVSEWLVFIGLFDAAISHGPPAWGALAAIVMLGVTGALALACFVKVCGVVFLGAPRTNAAARAHESGRMMLGPMAVLAFACVAIGLAPAVFWPAIARAVSAWRAGGVHMELPAPLIVIGAGHAGLALLGIAAAAWLWRRSHRNGLTRALTWDCGYNLPTARMQYTAGSFAGIITEWFGWILRPHRHDQRPEGTHPAHARFDEHSSETVLEHVIEPAGRVVMHLSSAARRLQHGRVQSYLFYVVAGLAALAVLVLAGGGR